MQATRKPSFFAVTSPAQTIVEETLFDALAAQDDDQLLISMLAEQPNLEITDAEGNTPLLTAASDFRYCKNAFHLLAQAGAKLDAKNKRGETIRYFALRDYEPQLLQFAAESKIEYPLPDRAGNYLLHVVAKGDGAETINPADAKAAQKFIKEMMQQAEAKSFFDANSLGNTCLHELVLVNNLNALVALLLVLPAKMSPEQIKNFFGAKNLKGDTAFHLLARSRQWQMMNMLAGECLKYKITPDFLNTKLRTPLEEMMSSATIQAQIDLENVAIFVRCGANAVKAIAVAREKKFKDAVIVMRGGSVSVEMKQQASLSPQIDLKMPTLDKMMSIMESDTRDGRLYRRMTAQFAEECKPSALQAHTALRPKRHLRNAKDDEVYVYFRCVIL